MSLFLTVVLYVLAALIYFRKWQGTPTRPLAALAISSVFLAETATAAHFGVLWQLSFWLYHVLLMCAVLTATYGIAIGYEKSGSLSRAVEGLLLGATLQRQRDAFQSGMSTLLAALSQGDARTNPALRLELRQRLGLAEDQIALLEHAVQVVALERDEQRRLRALVEVGRALTVDLDPDHLLHTTMITFASITEHVLCAVGLVDGHTIVFQPQHRIVRGQPASRRAILPLSAVPATWQTGDTSPWIDSLGGVFRPLLPEASATLAVPVRHQDRLAGVMLVQPGLASAVDDGLVKVCNSIALHLAMALTNAGLFQDLQHKHEELLRSERARDQLTQMVVHDLKNPLSAIQANLSILDMTRLTEEQHEIIEDTSTSTMQMLHLVTDLLDIARLEEGRLELRRAPTNVNDLLQSCASELHPWATQAQKRIEVAHYEDMPLLLIDARLMRRVITNLLSNAIKHTPSGTVIRLGAEVDTAGVELSVQDDGDGIVPEQQASLFERFKTGTDTNTQQSNTGLGLTFCKLAVEAHAGTIGISSASGVGATFLIRLPLETIEELVVG